MKSALIITLLIFLHWHIASPSHISFGLGLLIAWEIGKKLERYIEFKIAQLFNDSSE